MTDLIKALSEREIMSDLTDALRAQVEWSHIDPRDSSPYYEAGLTGARIEGSRDEHARLAPILEKLIAVVEAAEPYVTYSPGNGYEISMKQALADLRAAVGMGEEWAHSKAPYLLQNINLKYEVIPKEPAK